MNKDSTPRIKADFAASDKWSHERREDGKENRRPSFKKILAGFAIVGAFASANLFVANKITDKDINRRDQVTRQYKTLHDSIEQNEAH